jgi:hypothetical protein
MKAKASCLLRNMKGKEGFLGNFDFSLEISITSVHTHLTATLETTADT